MSRMTLSVRARERGGKDGTGRGKGGEKRDGKKRSGGEGLHLKAQILTWVATTQSDAIK
jgi:hypothetical protein